MKEHKMPGGGLGSSLVRQQGPNNCSQAKQDEIYNFYSIAYINCGTNEACKLLVIENYTNALAACHDLG